MSYFNVICENCKYKEEDFENPIGKPFPKCPSCKKKKLIKDWSSPEACPDFHIYEVKTAIQQSEKNIKAMGKEKAQIKYDNLDSTKKKKAPKPFYWSENQTKPLDISKIKNIRKFIDTGDKE